MRKTGVVTITARRTAAGVEAAINGVPATPARSQRCRNYSPTGFNFGYGGSGPAQLALAILLEVGFSDADAVALHQRFKWDFLAPAVHEGHAIRITLDVGEWARDVSSGLAEGERWP